MRLSNMERRAVARALRDVPYPAYWFGSRLDDARRGGDIDVALFTRGMDEATRFRLSLRVAALFRSVCDEKVDVQVFDEQAPTPAERAFLASIEKRRIDASDLALQ